MTETDHKEPLYQRRPRGCGPIFFALILIVGASWGAALGYFVELLEGAQTRLDVLEDFRPKVGSKIYDKDGALLGEYTVKYRQLVALNEIPLDLQRAFLATEDHLFYEHKGVRPDAMFKAAIRSLRTDYLQGGSTITQQLVRNLEGKLVGRERTLRRKFEEMLIALQLEREYTKDEILELYLNMIFLGGSASGVEAASRQYYGKRSDELTLGEMATLAGLTRGPNINRPDRFPEKARKRRDIVLAQMLENGYISQQEHEAAVAEPIRVITNEERLAMLAEGRGYWGPNEFLAPYFVEEVRRRIRSQNIVTGDELRYGGLEIYTTLDIELQKFAEQTLFAALNEFDERKRSSLERRGRLDEFKPVSGALVCIDNRPGYEGYVRALVGGRDWESEKFNTVTQAKRQPGSGAKPFVWTAALADKQLTPSSIVLDAPFSRKAGSGKIWSPKNYDGKYLGEMTMRRALERSRNTVSVRLAERVGLPLIKGYMERAGIRESEIRDEVSLTIALGTPVVTVLEQCVAFSTYAKNGAYAPPVFVKEIRNADGYVTYENEPDLEPGAIPADLAYVVNYLMQGVCLYGTGTATRELGERPRGGKTGTTNESRDTWFNGFTADYTCVVWVGYRDNSPLGKYTGGSLACPIWTDFMVRAHEDLPIRDFPVPDGVEFYDVDRNTGLKGGGFREAFLEGTEPPTSKPKFVPPEDLERLMEEEMLQPLMAEDGGGGRAETEAASVEPRRTPVPLPGDSDNPPRALIRDEDLLAPL